MKKVLTAIVAAVVSAPSLAAGDELAGTYNLVSSTRKLLDTGEVRDTYGKHPKGTIIYAKDGHFLATIIYAGRPHPESLAKLTDQQRADLFRTMLAYGGTYKFDGKTVFHKIDMSWNEVWTGTTVVRDIRKDGNRLIYTTRPAPFSGDGKMSVVTLVWEKVQ